MNLQLESEAELENDTSNNKYYVSKTVIEPENIFNEIIDIFDTREKALEYSKESIKELVGPDYLKIKNGFYGDDGIKKIYVFRVHSINNALLNKSINESNID